MKRITYISKFSRPFLSAEVEDIGRISQRNNQQAGITGVLVCSNGIFFQILEGESEAVDRTFERILCDERHTDILCLKTETDVEERLFPEWSMHAINLDENTDILIQPIKSLLQTVTSSHRILEKYTQPTILEIISRGINPLQVKPQLVERIVMFADIASFSTFVEKLPVETVVEIVDRYFSSCTAIVRDRGGEVNKYIGDCIMAYFPIEQADDAIQAGLDILSETEMLRNSAPKNNPFKVLYCGIGLACGPVIEGNIGSTTKVDYTILGDAVNVAQRLEASTRDRDRALIFPETLAEKTRAPWNFVELDRTYLKGKQTATTLYSIDDPTTAQPLYARVRADKIRNALERIARQSGESLAVDRR